MKKILWILFLAIVLPLILALAITRESLAENIKLVSPIDPLTYQQKAWLGALEWCESRGNPNAINPKDRDNTPSYGILQFKPKTFALYVKQYNLGVYPKGYIDPQGQEDIVTAMIIAKHVNWHQQFPDCVKKLGNPPVIHTASIYKK